VPARTGPGPVPAAVVVALTGGRLVAATRTDAAGRFLVTLPAGRYLIRATNVGGYRSTAARTVTVAPTGPVSLTLVLDTGIR
jgi:Carboxypeptidase regulatory-like domain